MRFTGIALALGLAAAACGTPAAAPPDEPGAAGDTPYIAATIEIGRAYAIAAGPTGVWTASYEEGTVRLVDPSSNEIAETIEVTEILGSGASDVHPVEGHVWLAASDSSTIGHLDPDTLVVDKAATMKPAGFIDVTAAGSEVWVAQHSGYRYPDPVTSHGATIRSANKEVPAPGEKFAIYSDIASGGAGVWALDESHATVSAIAPTTGEPRVVRTEEDDFRGGQADIAVGHGYVWVETSSGDGTRIARYDPATDEIESVTVPGDGQSVTMSPDALWVMTFDEKQAFIWRFDPQTLAHGEPFTMDGEFQLSDMTYGFGSIWVSHDTNLLTRIDVSGTPSPEHTPAGPEKRGDASVCDSTGPWVWCREANWMRRVALEAGLEVTGDTGTAYSVTAGEHRLHAWNADAAEPFPPAGYEPLDGTDAYTDGTRIVWEAQGLHLYLSSADNKSLDSLPTGTIERMIEVSRVVPMEADLSGAKPQPTPTAKQRFEQVGDRVKVWPVTEDVANEGKYLFTAPHCGLDWMLDFDGTFWDAIEPDDYGDGENYSFFYNSDEGAITFTGDDTATYQASTGEKVDLVRLDGPIVVHPCA
jgi:streptogramin lyase